MLVAHLNFGESDMPKKSGPQKLQREKQPSARGLRRPSFQEVIGTAAGMASLTDFLINHWGTISAAMQHVGLGAFGAGGGAMGDMFGEVMAEVADHKLEDPEERERARKRMQAAIKQAMVKKRRKPRKSALELFNRLMTDAGKQSQPQNKTGTTLEQVLARLEKIEAQLQQQPSPSV
jgi:hypothetical protein